MLFTIIHPEIDAYWSGENAYTRDLVMDWFCVTMNVSEMHNATTITEFSIDV